MPDLFEFAAAAVTEELVPASSLTVARRLQQLIPETLSAASLFECRLGEGAPHADWQTCLQAPEGRERLHGVLEEGLTDQPDAAAWDHVRRFAKSWRDPSAQSYSASDHAWLEFDIGETGAGLPSPCLFAGLGSSPYSASRRAAAQPTSVDELLGLLAEQADGGRVEAWAGHLLRRCFEALLPGMSVSYLAWMTPRRARALRLVVRAEPASLRAYLTALGGPAASRAGDLAEDFSRFGKLAVNLDLREEGLGPVLGLECFVGREQHGRSLLEPLLNECAGRKLCTMEQRAALLAWPSVQEFRRSNGTEAFRYFRRVMHVKLMVQPDAPLSAKAYLAYWRRDSVEVMEILRRAAATRMVQAWAAAAGSAG